MLFVLLSRIFLFFEQDFVYKLLFYQRSLRLCGELLSFSGCGYAAPGSRTTIPHLLVF